MRDNDIGDVLIMDQDGRLRGIVTDRDIIVRGIANDRQPDSTPIGEVCSPDLVAVDADDDADQAVQMMRQRAVRRIPVMEDGQVIGVVSLGDMAIEKDPDSALAQISAAPENL
jgi:CBS domain-containing protein